jgi:hypothetical protein
MMEMVHEKYSTLLTEFIGPVLTTILPILFQYCYKCCKYIHAGQTEMLCSHLGNTYSILKLQDGVFNVKVIDIVCFKFLEKSCMKTKLTISSVTTQI